MGEPQTPTRRAWAITRVVLGLLLLTAAGLKAAGFRDPSMGTTAGADLRLQAAAMVGETALGLWLLPGVYPAVAWSAALCTFALFGVVSLRAGLLGQATCGCLGVVAVSPWPMFALDVAAVLALLAVRPRSAGSLCRTWANELRAAAVRFIPPVLVIGAAFGLAELTVGGVSRGWAAVLQQPVQVRPRALHFGEVTAGTVAIQEVEVANRGPDPVRLIGGTSDCSCMASEGLPLTIPPGESRAVKVVLRAPRVPGSLARPAYFWTDQPDGPKVWFGLSATITPARDVGRAGE